MASLKAIELKQHLEREGLLPVYALIGEDDALVSESIALLKAAAERPDLPGSMTTDVEEEADPREVFDELRTQPFMGMAGVRVVIVREGTRFAASHGELLLKYLETPSKSGVLVLCCKKLDGRTAAAKTLRSTGLVVQCDKLDWRNAKDIVRAEGRARGKGFTPEAVQLLVDAVGPNLAALRQEMDKLLLYAGDEATVTARHVEDVVPQSRSRSIFDLSDAIVQGNAPAALRLGQELLLRGQRPEGLVAFLASQVRRTWQVKRMLGDGASKSDVMRTLSMPDFAVDRAARAAQGRDEAWFVRCVERMARADVELKTTAVQARQEPVWLSVLLAELCE